MNATKYKNNAPGYTVDAFSQVLKLLQMDVNIYHNAKVCGNWMIRERSTGATCFHIVTTGSVVLDVPGILNSRMEAGDLVIFPRELPHTLVSAVPLSGKQRHLDYREAKDEEGTGLLCGEVSLQYECGHYILDALPPVFIIRCNEKNNWLKLLLGMFHIENMQAGPAFKAIIDRLTELLFTYSLRQFLVDHPDKVGMMALYAHPRLSRAIEKVHRQPEKEWTLDDMAREAAMSRTSFSETFKSVSGWTAGQYLTWWRMQTAWVLLNNGGNLAEVSGKVGYKSESAFSRAFQKMFRVTAGKVRKFGPKKPGVIESGAITE